MTIFRIALTVMLCAFASVAWTQGSLKGSRAKVEAAHKVALEHDFTFLTEESEVARFVSLGLLVPLTGNENYRLEGPRLPYVRPAVKLFIDRLSKQYRSACGERLDVTGATRTWRLWNSSPKSVHPTGMAVDLRIPKRVRCRKWLEATLVVMRRHNVILPTREKNPPHYHVAVYPNQYKAYVAARTGSATTRRMRSR